MLFTDISNIKYMLCIINNIALLLMCNKGYIYYIVHMYLIIYVII